MPGTFTIDTAATFTAAIFMSGAAKMRFGTAEQDVSATGERKWTAQLAVTYRQDRADIKAVSEVIEMTITGPADDPTAQIPPGTPVQIDGLRLGISAPEKRENGRGIMGGKPWFSATAIRPAAQQHQRKPEAA
jgi:hypothetical protein